MPKKEKIENLEDGQQPPKKEKVEETDEYLEELEK